MLAVVVLNGRIIIYSVLNSLNRSLLRSRSYGSSHTPPGKIAWQAQRLPDEPKAKEATGSGRYRPFGGKRRKKMFGMLLL